MYESLRYEVVAVRHAELQARLTERRAGAPSRPPALLRLLHEPPPAQVHADPEAPARRTQHLRRLVTMRWKQA
jgi:hypothetical protein